MIKKITVKDLKFARKLRNDNRKHFFNDKKIGKLDHLVWFVDLQLNKKYKFYIIWEKGKRVGTISTLEHEDQIELGNIIVDKKYRKKGYCSNALTDMLYLHQDKKIFLKVIPSNKVAIKSYEAIGFKEKERTLWI